MPLPVPRPLFRARSFPYLVSVLILWLQRSPVLVRLVQLEPLLAPRLAWVAKGGLPLLVLASGAHSVTGATEIVPVAPSANPAEVTVGETFTWVFRSTEGKKAQSYSVEGLPPGVYLSPIVTQGVSSLAGTPTQAGQYEIRLVGWELAGTRGDRTPTYRLTLDVLPGEPPVIDTPPGGGQYEAGQTIALGVLASGPDLSYEWRRDGHLLEDTVRPWVGLSTPIQALVPMGPVPESWRSDPGFDATTWMAGHSGVGYELSSSATFDPYFGIDLEDALYDRNTSALVRIPFHLVPEDLRRPNFLKLRLRYDDGFVAYLNGQKVAEANAPADLTWNAEATNSHDDLLAVEFEERDLVDALPLLKEGPNLLAIHALNQGVTGSDFLMQAELLGGLTYNRPNLHLHDATAADSGTYTVTVRNVTGEVTSEPVPVEVTEAQTPIRTYHLWASEHWETPALENPLIAGFTADPDGDGVPNGVECFAGTDPTVADSRPSFRITTETRDGVTKLLVQIPMAAASDLLPRVQVSSTLRADSWQTLTGEEEGVEIVQASGSLTITLRKNTTFRFLRLVVATDSE